MLRFDPAALNPIINKSPVETDRGPNVVEMLRVPASIVMVEITAQRARTDFFMGDVVYSG